MPYIIFISLITCIIFILSSTNLFNKERLHCIIIAMSGLLIRIYFARLDRFLHTWDEKFHALVARNMVDHPITPMLRQHPILPYNKFDWCCNHIWVHKQPLFLLQMAASIKLLGATEFAIRLPSVIMGSIMPLMLYDIVKHLLKNTTTAFIAALLFCFSYFQLELISGYYGTDHNDVAFGFYVLASIWAYCKYLRNKGLLWVIIIGYFAGLAVLNKWLQGLVIYLGWFINIIVYPESKDSKKKEFLQFALSLVVAVAIFLPWQLYILHRFPEEAKYVYDFNRRHITEALEGHRGTILYYLGKYPLYYGYIGMLLIPIGFYLLVRNKSSYHNKAILLHLSASYAVVTIFFSIIVKTKWLPYVYIVAPIGFIFAAIALQYVLEKRKYWGYTLILTAIITALNPWKVYNNHNPNDPERIRLTYNTTIYKRLNSILKTDAKVVVNLSSFQDIDVMFYQNNLNVYSWTLNPHVVDSLKQAKVRIAAFKPHQEYNLPEYIYKYPYFEMINVDLK